MITSIFTSPLPLSFMDSDYYHILGVERTASALEIKDAYRRLVRLHHPDANPENREASEALMKRVLQAYATVGDVDKRTHYDNDVKLRAFEKLLDDAQNRVAVAPCQSCTGQNTPNSLIGKARCALGDSHAGFAAKLGVSEADLHAFETRDSMPHSTIQLLTFGIQVEHAAQKLESDGQTGAAADLRSTFRRKKANRNFMK